jgi:S-formylglutathione hydrolase FrmB
MRAWGRRVAAAAAAVMLMASALGARAATVADRVVTITIPDRHGEIPARWLTYAGPPRANVLLPPTYDPSRAYPLLMLLPGFGNTYASFTDPNALDAQRILEGLDAVVVIPEGGRGWYADWWNNGSYGTPEWESYVIDEVLPQILARYRILPERRYHALFGISMGGLGAAYLGGRLPGFFGSIGILSGFVDLQAAPLIVSLGMDAVTGVAPGSIVGPESGFYAAGHNPAALVDNLRDTRIYMTAGDGLPTAPDGSGGGVGNVEEAGVIRPMSDAYASALRAAHIGFVYDTHTGCHCWPDFQTELRAAIAWGPFKAVVEHPAGWVNSTVATHGQLWDIGYRFAAHPRAVVQFRRAGNGLSISAAGTDVTITTSGGCVLHSHTPATIEVPTGRCP